MISTGKINEYQEYISGDAQPGAQLLIFFIFFIFYFPVQMILRHPVIVL